MLAPVDHAPQRNGLSPDGERVFELGLDLPGRSSRGLLRGLHEGESPAEES